jgi:glycosyltransferase involved in cell wall biosynthesis
MKYSIITPTHDRADVLPFAVRSEIAQTESDWELFIVGDGCTDNTPEVVAEFSDPRIRWLDLPKGPGFGYTNRNLAFRQMHGHYVALLAHDDIWLPDHLALLSHCLEQSGAEWAYSRPIWGEPGGALLPGDFDLATDAAKRKRFLQRKLNGIPASCVIYRRDCFARYGYWNEALPACGDADMWVRIVAGTSRLGYLSTPTCLHFRANWRETSNVISRLTAYPELLSKLPALRLPPGRNDQDSAWSCITKDPDWITSLQLAVDRADELLDEKAKHRLTTIYRHLFRRFSPLKLRSLFFLRQRFSGSNFFR